MNNPNIPLDISQTVFGNRINETLLKQYGINPNDISQEVTTEKPKFNLISPTDLEGLVDNSNEDDIRYVLTLIGRTPLPFQRFPTLPINNYNSTLDNKGDLDPGLLELEDSSSYSDISPNIDQDFNPYIAGREIEFEIESSTDYENIETSTQYTTNLIASTFETLYTESTIQQDERTETEIGFSSTTPYVKIINVCNEIHSEEFFTLQSPNYPNEYMDDLDCEYLILPFSSDICQVIFYIS